MSIRLSEPILPVGKGKNSAVHLKGEREKEIGNNSGEKISEAKRPNYEIASP